MLIVQTFVVIQALRSDHLIAVGAASAACATMRERM